MSGGILSDVAAALRLGGHLRNGTIGVSEGTARRALGDQADVDPEKHEALMRALVAGLFTDEYLADRGLGPEEITAHNALVTTAVRELAQRAEWLAVLVNQMRIEPPLWGFAFITSGLQQEVVLRAAAYSVVFGRLHGPLDRVEDWLREPGLSIWFRDVMRRAGVNQLPMQKLADGAGVALNTVKALKRGTNIPREDTVVPIAETLADHGLIDPATGRMLTGPEIEFELRIACAVAVVRQGLRKAERRELAKAAARDFHFLRARLRGYPRAEVEDLLARGTSSLTWPCVAVELHQLHEADLLTHTTAAKAHTDRAERVMRKDPKAAMRLMEEQFTRQASFLREVPAHGLDLDGPAKRLAELYEGTAGIMRVATGESGNIPRLSYPPEALKADMLVAHALSPWANHSDEEKENLLRQATAASPTSADARVHLARHLHAHGQVDEAVDFLREALHADASHWGARRELALILGNEDRCDEALDALDAAPTPSSDPTVHAVRGWCLLHLGRADEGERILREVVATHAQNFVALKGLALCHRRRGEAREASDLERRAAFFIRGSGAHR
jgi:tetratricopeptide (TPR) repeat protein